MALSQKAQATRAEAETIVARIVSNDDGAKLLAATAPILAQALAALADVGEWAGTRAEAGELVTNVMDFVGRTLDRLIAAGLKTPITAQDRAAVKAGIVQSIEALDAVRAAAGGGFAEWFDSLASGFRIVGSGVVTTVKEVAFPVGLIFGLGLVLVLVVKYA